MHRGSCLCGRGRYALSADLGELGYCHCTSCRKASGSAHAANWEPIDDGLPQFAEWAARDVLEQKGTRQK
jgi:hypothetical protein